MYLPAQRAVVENEVEVEHVSILTPKLDDVFVAITVVERRIGADADEGSVAR